MQNAAKLAWEARDMRVLRDVVESDGPVCSLQEGLPGRVEGSNVCAPQLSFCFCMACNQACLCHSLLLD